MLVQLACLRPASPIAACVRTEHCPPSAVRCSPEGGLRSRSGNRARDCVRIDGACRRAGEALCGAAGGGTGRASGAGSLAQVTLSLVLVLAAVFAAAWAMRSLRGFGRSGAGAIEIVAEIALGPKERAVLMQVGKQQLLLGVTAIR